MEAWIIIMLIADKTCHSAWQYPGIFAPTRPFNACSVAGLLGNDTTAALVAERQHDQKVFARKRMLLYISIAQGRRGRASP